MICEKCKNEHDGSYGSGRFCSSTCARSFSTSKKRKEINKKVSLSLKGFRTIPGGKIKLCDYGCGQEANYPLKNGKWCCSEFFNQCPKIKNKNSNSLKNAHKKGRPSFPKDAYLKGHKSLRKNLKKKYDLLDFTEKPMAEKRRIILREQNNKCSECGIELWNEKPITLQLDHIDGNNRNEERENLRLLCPNCHSQTETFCGKNIKKYNKSTISDKDFLIILKNSENIHQALKQAGLTSKGRNYKRAYTLLADSIIN